MDGQIDLRGASGAAYRYRLENPKRPSNAVGANYVYVREGEHGPQVLYAGQTDGLAHAEFEHWAEAVSNYGATHLFTRLNVSGATRTQELNDLIGGLKPVMNEDLASGAPLTAEFSLPTIRRRAA